MESVRGRPTTAGSSVALGAEPLGDGHTRVTHTYDWSQLTDQNRLPRARATTREKLRASLDRLAELAERH